MRVVQVIGGAETGGSRTHLLALCRGLRESDPATRVEIVCLLEGPVAEAARERGFPVTVLPMHGAADLGAIGRLRRHLRLTLPAVVHTHGVRANFVGRLASRGLPVAVVSTVHSSVHHDYASPVKRLLCPTLERATRGRVDAFIAVSAALGVELERDGVPGERIAVIGNRPEPQNPPAPAPPKATLRAELGIPAGVPLLLGVGRLETVKGFDVLLEVLARLDGRIAFHAAIAGDGSRRRRLERRARDLGLSARVSFLGHRPDAAALMRQADLLVATSRMEGSPMALLEAMEARLPVVATAVGGVPELVGAARNGLAVPAGDVAGLAARIELLLRRPRLRRGMGRRGAEALVRRFAPGVWVEETRGVYERAVAAAADRERRRTTIGTPTRARRRVTIAGYFGAGNTGDEAILAGMIRALRCQGIDELTVLSWDPEETRRRHGVRSLWIGRRAAGLGRLFAHLRGEDLFVLGGGGLLQDGSARVVPFWASRVLLALAAGTPVMYYGIGVGPLDTALGRWIVGAVSNLVRAITVRDAASKALLEAVGVRRPPIEVTADPALCLALPAAAGCASGEAPGVALADGGPDTGASRGRLRIAVCLRDWPGFAALLPPLADCLTALDRHRPVGLVLVPFHEPGDRAVGERLAGLLAAGPEAVPCRLLDPGAGVGEIAAALAASDGVIAMRLHAAVLAALAGVPAFGLVYDPKVRLFLDRIDGAAAEGSATLAELRDGPGEVARRLIGWLGSLENRRRVLRPAGRELVAEAERPARIVQRLVDRQEDPVGRPAAGRPRQSRILGQPVHLVDLPAALDWLSSELGRGAPQFVVAQNPETVMRCCEDAELAEIVGRRATLVVPDGVGLAVAGRLLGLKPIPRLPGIELFEALLGMAATEGWTVFLYGAAPGVAARAAAVAAGRHPGLRVAGTLHGFDGDEAAVVDAIRRAAPDFLFVALGTPAQERWIARHRERLPVALAMGVGGSFDVLAGRVARAPAVWRRAGLEWLYRLGRQPRRWRRMRVLPVYLWRVAMDRHAGRRAWS